MWSLLIVVLVLAALLVLRMPVAFAMGATGIFGLVLELGWAPAFSVLERTFFDTTSSFILVAIPLFILMAELMTAGDVTRRAVNACLAWIGHVRGGLAMATVCAAVILAALIGSSTASAAAMATAAFPEMRRARYADRLASAVVSVGGTLAVVVPPSIVLVVYGVLTETSIGRLFIAGIVPGLLTAIGLLTTIRVMAVRGDSAPAGEPFDLKRAVRQSVGIWPVCGLIVLIIGSIYTGIASPTEAAGLGAVGAFVIGVCQRTVGWANASDSLSSAIRATVMIITIVACSAIFANFLAFTQVTQNILVAVEESPLPPHAILALIILILLFMGMVMDQLAILSLAMPLAFPATQALGFDPVWLGIVVTKTVEIGLLTPPLGLNAYVTASQTGVPLNTVFRGLIPFIAVEIGVLCLLVAVPELALWLPGKMW